MRAWVEQDKKQVAKRGKAKASWYAVWRDPVTRKKRYKSYGPGSRGKRNAEAHARRIEGEVAAGTYKSERKASWDDFVSRYERECLSSLRPNTRSLAKESLDRFAKMTKVSHVSDVRTKHVDKFVVDRLAQPGLKRGSMLSPATVKKDLRHVRAALVKAVDWELIEAMPKFPRVREPKKIPRFVTPEHFLAMYLKCDAATHPVDIPNVTPGDWWRAWLTFAYMTGWRRGDLLSLKWEDVDLDDGTTYTRWDQTKGIEESRVKLHQHVIDHLKAIEGSKLAGRTHVFEWNHALTHLRVVYGRIQAAAEISLPCREKHDHDESCGRYTLHQLRYGFATMNSDRLPPMVLQSLMRHSSFATTQRYIGMKGKLAAEADVFVPEFPERKADAQ